MYIYISKSISLSVYESISMSIYNGSISFYMIWFPKMGDPQVITGFNPKSQSADLDEGLSQFSETSMQ